MIVYFHLFVQMAVAVSVVEQVAVQTVVVKIAEMLGKKSYQ